MSARNALVKQADLARILKAAAAGGLKLASVTVGPDGSVRLFAANAESSHPTINEANDWAGVGEK